MQCGAVCSCSLQNGRSSTLPFGEDRIQQIDRFDGASGGTLLRNGDDLAHARRHEYAVPRMFVAGSKGAASLRVYLAGIDVLLCKTPRDRTVMLLQQRNEQMLYADVVVVVIA